MAKLRIAHAASELAPLAKTGGLGDAVGSLARAQDAAGHRVVAFLPYYREVRLMSTIEARPRLERFSLHIAPGIKEEISVLEAVLPGSKVVVYLVAHAKSFDRDQLYGTPDRDYPDNADRFILFSRAVLQITKELKLEVDVLHVHDWQAALVPVYLSRIYRGDEILARTASVFTIHNLAYQGLFPKDVMPRTGLGWDLYTPDQLEFWGKVSFLKAGLLYADKLSTVSPTYAKEILTKDGGFGLDGVLRQREADLAGILNGLDLSEWDPSKDPHLAAVYSRRALAGKERCKIALREEFRLQDPGERQLLVGVVARLVEQKGLDLLIEALPRLAKKPVQFAVLGSGDRSIREALEDAARRFPGQLALRIQFDHALAHRIYAGADALLVPSRYEPCGLGQMIAQRYGTLPIARATGGLVDTIRPAEKRKPGTGFLFKAASADALAKAVEEAIAAYHDESYWKRCVVEAMGEDFSWTSSVRRYDALYEAALKRRAKSG
jgi:starch synthase